MPEQSPHSASRDKTSGYSQRALEHITDHSPNHIFHILSLFNFTTNLESTQLFENVLKSLDVLMISTNLTVNHFCKLFPFEVLKIYKKTKLGVYKNRI